MTYDIGTHIDLTHLNKKSEAKAVSRKSVFQNALETQSGYEVGTEFRFKLTPQGLTAARKIPVQFA